MSNAVTLTFAGDSSKLESAFRNVGSAAEGMKSKVDTASASVEEAGGAYDRAGEAADGAEGKAQGFSDVLTGTADIGAGTAEIMKGNLFEGFVTVGQGAADLAGGMASFLIPALSKLTKESLGNAVQMVRTNAVTLASKAANAAATVATNGLAVAQRVLNAAMRANPIGLIVTALTLLVGGLVYAYKHSEKFRNIVNGALNAVKSVAQAVGGWIANTLWPWLRDAFNRISGAATSVKNGIVGAFSGIVGWLKGFPGTVKSWFDAAVAKANVLLDWAKSVPGKIGGFFKGIGNAVAGPFKAAFQAIKDFWNNTIGGKGLTIPGWVPNIGGKDFRIPYFHTGGIVPGGLGSESLAVLKAGERVTSGTGSSGGGGNIVLQSDGTKTGDLLVRLLKETIRVRGGNVQVVLGNG